MKDDNYMPKDGESFKPKFGTDDTTKKSKFDYTRGQSRDLPTPKNSTEASIDTPQTLEQGLQSVCKKAFELNKSEDQPEGRFTRITERFDLSGADAEKLQQMAERCEQSKAYNGPRDTQMIISDFKDVISLALDYRINESLKAIKKKNDQKQPVDQKDVVEIHAAIHSTILGSGVYYLSVSNSLPFERQDVAKAQLGRPIIEFQKTIGNFLKALDETFPWKYSNSLGSAFGLEEKASLPDSVRLSLDEIKNTLEKKQKAVGETQNVISEKRWDLAERVLGLEPGALSHSQLDRTEKALKQKQKALQEEYQALQDLKDFLYGDKKLNTLEEKRKALIKSFDTIADPSQKEEQGKREKRKRSANSIKSRL